MRREYIQKQMFGVLTLTSYHGFIYILPIRKKSGGFGKYRAGGTFGNGACYGKIRERQGSVIPGIVT